MFSQQQNTRPEAQTDSNTIMEHFMQKATEANVLLKKYKIKKNSN